MKSVVGKDILISDEIVTRVESAILQVGKLLETEEVLTGKANVIYRSRVPVEPGAIELAYCVGNTAILIEVVLAEDLEGSTLEFGPDGKHDQLYKEGNKVDEGVLVSRRVGRAWRSAYESTNLKFYSLAVAVNAPEDFDISLRGVNIVSLELVQEKIEIYSSYADSSDVTAADVLSFCALTEEGYTTAELCLEDGTAWVHHKLYPSGVDLDGDYTLHPGIGARSDSSIVSRSSMETAPEHEEKSGGRRVVTKADIVTWSLIPLILYFVLMISVPEHRHIWSILGILAGILVPVLGRIYKHYKRDRFVQWTTFIGGTILVLLSLIDIIVKGI